MGILVVASPKVLFVQGFKAASRLIDDESLVQRNALDLHAAPAERDIRVFKKLLGLAEILVGFEIDLVVVKKTADVAHHDVRADGTGKRHDLAVAELFKHQGDGLLEGEVLFFAELHGVSSFAIYSYFYLIESGYRREAEMGFGDEVPKRVWAAAQRCLLRSITNLEIRERSDT